MRGVHLLHRPDGIRPRWWRAGLALWVMTFLIAGIFIARGLAFPAVVATWERLQTPPTDIVNRAVIVPAGPAPDFTLRLFDGGAFHLAEHRRQVVVVNFWASWCVPCRREARRLVVASHTYRDRGVVFVGIDIQDTDNDARAFLRQYSVQYPNGPDRNSSVSSAFRVVGVPTTYFIDRRGQIRRRWMGEIHDSQLARFIGAALQ